MLVAATVLATDDAFAGGPGKKKRGGDGNSQATAQVNKCGNDFQPYNVFCQNLASQIQGNDNFAALAGAQGEVPEDSQAPEGSEMAKTDGIGQQARFLNIILPLLGILRGSNLLG